MTFGERLRQIRGAARLTQVALARRSGVSQGSISLYEAGLHEPTWSTLAALCRGLGVTPDAFWTAAPVNGVDTGPPQSGARTA